MFRVEVPLTFKTGSIPGLAPKAFKAKLEMALPFL